MENCTIYSHYIAIEKIIPILKQHFPSAQIEITGTEQNWSQLKLTTGKSFWKKGSTFTVYYRQRLRPDYKLVLSEEPLIKNLVGMYNFVSSFPAQNPDIYNRLLQKITTLNAEISFAAEPGFIDTYVTSILTIAQALDGIIFSNPNSVFPDLGMYDKNGVLLLSNTGKSDATTLDVSIESKYYDQVSGDEPDERKDRTNELLQSHGIAINVHLPRIANESEVTIRTPYEIAERVTVLSLINLVAFNSVEPTDAIQYFKQYNLWDKVTENEKDLLENPTQSKKDQATWQCEGIWVLLWALGKAEAIPFPDHLCSLNDLDFYPFQGFDQNPNEIIQQLDHRRTDTEILDNADLYYRLDWACVNARIKGQEMALVHPGVVYERHYALNWLIRNRDQEWDDVTCDT